MSSPILRPTPRQQVLIAARALIDSCAETYICYALLHIGKCRPGLRHEAQCLRREIERSLGCWPTMGRWMSQYSGHSPTPQQIHLARLAWLDKLIESETLP